MAFLIAPAQDLTTPLREDGTRLAAIYDNLESVDVNRGTALSAPPNEILDNAQSLVRTAICVG